MARPAIFSTRVFGRNGYKILFLRVFALSLNSGRAQSDAQVAWLTDGYESRVIPGNRTIYFRNGLIRIHVQGNRSHILKKVKHELAWTVSYTTLSNPKFGVESIEFLPGVQHTDDLCFGTLADGCTFDPQMSLKQAGIVVKKVCERIPIIGLHIVGYELSYPNRNRTLARLVNNEGSGGQDSTFALLFSTDRANLCNLD